MSTLNEGQADLIRRQMDICHDQMEVFKANKKMKLLGRALAHYRHLNNKLSLFPPKLKTHSPS